MDRYIELMENIITEIEKTHPNLEVSEWLSDYENYIKYSLKNNVEREDILSFVKSVRFYINADSGIFSDIKIDFNDIYSDISFDYTINDGVGFETNPCITDVLDQKYEEQIFDAIGLLIPEQMNTLRIQWTFWNIQQKIDFIPSLEQYVVREIQVLRDKISEPFFNEIEKGFKTSILSIVEKQIETMN